jgi:hypothetical protein
MFPTAYFAPSYFAPSYFARVEFTDRTVVAGTLQWAQRGTDLFVQWKTTAPAGTIFQLYAGAKLLWHGTQTKTVIPVPPGFTACKVGTVWAVAPETDYSSTFASTGGSGDHASVTWTGGSYLEAGLSATLAGFHVYGSSAPGGSVNYVTPLDTVGAYPGGVVTDGFGMGGFGAGGFGESADAFAWTSNRLAAGVWQFDVKAFDSAGNEGSGFAGGPVSITITTRPRPPAPNSSGKRLTYTYNQGTGVVTLAWLASPG